jgi:hypothetical protein
MGPSILTKPFPLVLDLLFVIGLLVLAGAIGDRILRLLGVSQKELTTPERVALCGALGLGILQYVFLILGALHVLSSASVGLILLALFVLFGSAVRGIISSGMRYALRLHLAHWELMAKTLAVGIVVALCIALILSATPITDPDGLGYHVYALKWWMETQTLIALPTLIHTFSPMGGEMVMGLGFATWSDTSVKMIHWAFGALTLVALYAAGSRLTSHIGGLVVAGLFLAFAFPLYSWAYIDLGVALYVATACLAWIRWHPSNDVRWLRTAALCAGLAATFKLNLVLFGATLITLSVPTLLRRGSASQALHELVRIGALAGTPIVPWLVRTWILTGNPVYPFLHTVFPTPYWSAETAWAFRDFFQHYNWGSSHPEWSDNLRRGARLSAFVFVLALTGCCGFFIRDSLRRNLALLSGLVTLTHIWFLGLYVRLTLPFWPLFLLSVLSFTTALWTRREVRVVVPVLAVFALLWTLRGSIADIRDSLAFQVGNLSRIDYLRKRGFNTEMIELARREIPNDAVALLYPANGYYYNFRNLNFSPIGQRHIRFDTWEHFNDDIDAMRIRYLICNEELRVRSALPIDPLAANEQAFLRRLAAERAEKIATANGDALWKIRPRT